MAAERIKVGDIVFLRGRVTDIDAEFSCPIAIETVAKDGRPTEASLIHWFRPDHLMTVEEARNAMRK